VFALSSTRAGACILFSCQEVAQLKADVRGKIRHIQQLEQALEDKSRVRFTGTP
jgi:hypothetical protein